MPNDPLPFIAWQPWSRTPTVIPQQAVRKVQPNTKLADGELYQ